mmetsp:Transcript_98262/g.211915  ORF Transcript_98262/g.211915 Transcript_98262/m.211915 type:complete len:221 (-) Transcript_98262:1144-1806(-)
MAVLPEHALVHELDADTGEDGRGFEQTRGALGIPIVFDHRVHTRVPREHPTGRHQDDRGNQRRREADDAQRLAELVRRLFREQPAPQNIQESLVRVCTLPRAADRPQEVRADRVDQSDLGLQRHRLGGDQRPTVHDAGGEFRHPIQGHAHPGGRHQLGRPSDRRQRRTLHPHAGQALHQPRNADQPQLVLRRLQQVHHSQGRHPGRLQGVNHEQVGFDHA